MINNFNAEMKAILDSYELVAYKNLSTINKTVYTSNKLGKCRFCDKDSNQTTFKTKSHIFPQFIGNKYAISTFECDECNEKFSRTLENEFANFIKLFHTINGVRGANKIPTYKKNGIRISTIDGNHLKIEGVSDSAINEKGINFNIESDEFIPIAIYKMLTKMALSILSEKELSYFSKTFKWLQDETHLSTDFDSDCFPLLMTMNKSYSDKFNLSVLLAKKKNIDSNKPSYLFKLYYNIFSFQIVIPFVENDCIEWLSEKNNLQFIPNNFEIDSNIDASYRYFMDCNMKHKGILPINIDIINLDQI